MAISFALMTLAITISSGFMGDAGRTPALAYPCSGPTIAGDISGNQMVETWDGTWILRRIAALPLPEGGGGCASADVDCDHDVDTVDALKILRYVAGLSYTQKQLCPPIGTSSGT